MRNAFKIAVLCLTLSMVGLGNAESKPIRIGFLSPASCDAPFWGQVVLAAQAAAEDLEVTLIVKCDTNDTSYTAKKAGLNLLNTQPSLDYFITGYWSSVTKYLIRQASERNIKTFIINSDVFPEDRAALGEPRGNFPDWIGHMLPDDYQASRDLTKILVSRAKQLQLYAADKKIHFAGLSLSSATTVSTERVRGFTSQINVDATVSLDSITPVNRETAPAFELVKALLEENPDTAIICSSDQYGSWGAVQAIENTGKIAGKDIVVGGFDWNPNTLIALEDGRITATMFGHFLEGAWAVVLINDYHSGLDFVGELGTRILTPLRPINATNLSTYKNILNENYWRQVDFRRFSKKYNKNLKSYNFGIEQFLHN